MNPEPVELDPEKTEDSLGKGGSILGCRRFMDYDMDILTERIVKNLKSRDIDILYIIGGDGSLSVAHNIARKSDGIVVVGVPKTMDNDILWVWHSFGFDTVVERAATVVNTMDFEAESTGRICILELFGAQAGFVAANAALASGHVDLVLIPEQFRGLDKKEAKEAIESYCSYLQQIIRDKERAHFACI
ncbi:unnamed protein product [marine sediment metagenome]|uniref:Phosphofructokinase domain-containing protein n=1 Tax=marine sediment metagenome TaxID=412755 RepID=X1C4G2_9ZZZZ